MELSIQGLLLVKGLASGVASSSFYAFLVVTPVFGGSSDLGASSDPVRELATARMRIERRHAEGQTGGGQSGDGG